MRGAGGEDSVGKEEIYRKDAKQGTQSLDPQVFGRCPLGLNILAQTCFFWRGGFCERTEPDLLRGAELGEIKTQEILCDLCVFAVKIGLLHSSLFNLDGIFRLTEWVMMTGLRQ